VGGGGGGLDLGFVTSLDAWGQAGTSVPDLNASYKWADGSFL
jgi:hypothetical protein